MRDQVSTTPATPRCPLCGGPLDVVLNCAVEQTMIPTYHVPGRRLPTRILIARVAFCCACEFSEIR